MNDDLLAPPARSGSSRSSADLLRAAVDHISAMVAYWDSSLRCRLANRAYERWFGVSPEALIGRSLRELLGEALYDANRPYIEGVLRGESQEFERLLPDPAGGPPRPSLAQYIPDVVDGEVRGFFVLVSDVSTIKRAEQALRESEAQFSGIIDVSADAIVSIDADQNIVLFNEGAEKTFGWTRAEVMGKPVGLLLPERLREGHARYLEELANRELRTEHLAGGEETLVALHKDGHELPVEGTLSKLRLGERTLITVSLRDISERKRAENEARRLAEQREELLVRTEATNAQLREAEERFRLTIDEAPIGMALVALDGRFIRVNRALCEIVGYAPDELTGLTFQAITHPEDIDADLALAEQLLKGEIPRYQLGKRYVRKDDAIVDILLSGSVLRGSDGKPIHFIAQIEDVTERKRTEAGQRFLDEVASTLAASLEYEETLTTLAELAVRGFADMCFVDLVEDDDHVRRLKVAARDPARRELCERFMEMPPEPPRAQLLRGVLDTRKPLLVARPTDEVVASLARSEEHLALLRAADIRSILAVPLITHGQLLGALGFVSSTPARIYDDVDLRLAEEVAQRAARAIENARLYRTARRATQARDDVLGIVAHDLRSPLGIVLMQAQALRRQEAVAAREPASGERSRTPADVIERAAKRMNRLIQDLLDVTRIEAKRLRISPSALSVAQIVDDLVEAHRPVAAAASVELHAELAPDLPDVWADRDRLAQALENLVGNALKFTLAGGSITIGAVRRSGEVMFWVRDTGSGIAVDDVPHVFDRFWQADKGFRRGAGLGLPIVKGIVEAHHGLVWVESTPGRGTTFFFTIPTAQRALASRSERAASPAP